MGNEIWKDIPDYENFYQISNLGNVKSLNRVIVKSNNNKVFIASKLLNKEINRNGYLRVTLCRNWSKKHFYVHVLLAKSFLRHQPCKHNVIVDHIDGDIKNNTLENLQLISQRDNASKDRYKINYSSKSIGVYWHKASKKWASAINISGKSKHLGLFESEIEASEAYQKFLNLHNQEIISN